MAFLTSFPGNALWALLAVVFNAVKLPFWIVYYIPSSTRRDPRWSLRQCIGVEIVRAFLWNAAMVSGDPVWRAINDVTDNSGCARLR